MWSGKYPKRWPVLLFNTNFYFFTLACYFNVHKRCQKNVANNCGINARQLADILNDMGMTPHKLTTKVAKPPKKKVIRVSEEEKQ